MKLKLFGLFVSSLLIFGIAQYSSNNIVARDLQDQEDGQKGIQSAEVIIRPEIKPPTNSATKTNPNPKRPARRRTYSANKKRLTKPPARGEEDVRLGLTVFRYEPPGTTYSTGSDGTKDIGLEGTEEAPTPPKEASAWDPAHWTRATTKTQFAIGQIVRLHFEPLTQSGYLYIIHQELYADGTNGSATLLFPTPKLNGGKNLIKANQDLWIPRTGAYFRIKPSTSNKSHVGELFTVVVRSEAPAQILPETIGDKPMALTQAAFNKLTQGAIVPVIELNLDEGEGEKQTPRETEEGRKDIGVEGRESLTVDDALPQTVYEGRRKAGQPIVVRIPLRFKKQ